jgi:acetyl esterase
VVGHGLPMAIRGRRVLAVAVGTAAGVVVLARRTPLPSALLVRAVFTRGGLALQRGLRGRVPPDVERRRDLRYGEGRDEVLDVYRPAGTPASRLPGVLWIHGGAFLAGDKREIANYARILAARGYVVVCANYTRAPRAHFPVPVRQAGRASAWLVAHADELGVDADRVVLAGDSAGATIAALLATAVVDAGQARRLGVDVALPRSALRGLLLWCGAYDERAFDLDGPAGWFLRTVLWAATGARPGASATGDIGGVLEHLSSRFPPPFVSAGNADPLLPQSRALVAALARHDVAVDTLFFPDDHTPPLGHEYQFDGTTPAFDVALARCLAYLDRVAGDAATDR